MKTSSEWRRTIRVKSKSISTDPIRTRQFLRRSLRMVVFASFGLCLAALIPFTGRAQGALTNGWANTGPSPPPAKRTPGPSRQIRATESQCRFPSCQGAPGLRRALSCSCQTASHWGSSRAALEPIELGTAAAISAPDHTKRPTAQRLILGADLFESSACSQTLVALSSPSSEGRAGNSSGANPRQPAYSTAASSTVNVARSASNRARRPMGNVSLRAMCPY